MIMHVLLVFILQWRGARLQLHCTFTTPNRSDPNNVERSLHLPQHPGLTQIGNVDEDIISRVSVKRRTEPLLVKMVSNETDATTEDEETVESPNLDIFVSFFRGEGTAVAQEIDEADGDATIDVEDELLRMLVVVSVLVRNGDVRYLSCLWSLSQQRARSQAVSGLGSSSSRIP